MLDSATIRTARLENPKLRDRDLADQLSIPEAALVTAHIGAEATYITAHPDQLIPQIKGLGEVMALTRNESVVHEKVGVYENYHGGNHASMVVTEAVDLRMFPRHWVHAYAVVRETDTSTRRSIQVYDTAGDAVHKIFLREGSNLPAWEDLVQKLRLVEQPQTLTFAPREPAEAPKADPAKTDRLRQEWDQLTDTHQFLRLTSKLKMNRLGAYRIAGAPYVRPLAREAVNDMLVALAAQAVPFMLFVGNRGCIQIHSGTIKNLTPMGPWQNVMDPDFNLHLRRDHIAEVWQVEKPTARGPAISVEAFAEDGALILQAFGYRKEGADHSKEWADIVNALPEPQPEGGM